MSPRGWLVAEVASMRIPVAEGLFTVPDDGRSPQLIGSRCTTCRAVGFPASVRCVRCDADETEQVLLSPTGTLWTWTSQEFRPPSPPYAGQDDATTFRPFAVGYVELPDGIRVETRLTELDPELLQIGAAMSMTLVPFRTDDDGNDVVTFAFEPTSMPA